MNINLNSLLSKFIDNQRGSKCRAWYIISCVKYVKENDIDIHAYYEGMDYEERTKKDGIGGKGRS